MLRHVWSDGGAERFVDRVEEFVKKGDKGKKGSEDGEGKGEGEELERESVREMEAVVEFCRGKYGEGEVEDARGAFVPNDGKIKEMGREQVLGGKGFRKF